jgi:hypothetical protein
MSKPPNAVKSDYKVEWWDSTAGLLCVCGRGVIVDDEGEPKVCECGRKYTLVAYVIEQRSEKRCQAPGCNNWVFSSQPTAMYCSAVCSMKGASVKGAARARERRAERGR